VWLVMRAASGALQHALPQRAEPLTRVPRCWHGDLRALEEWRRLSTKVLNPEVPAFAQMLRLGEPV
jgi:hypothetical protein